MSLVESTLPIQAIQSQLTDAWNQGGAVVSAPPGSGKTTQLPLWLLELSDRPVFLLIPKRLAVTLAAKQLAANLGEPLGDQVGYQLRNDAKTGPKTRLLVTTYGTFLRILLNDPDRFTQSTIIFDEFHERSEDQDLSFALVNQYVDLLDNSIRRIIMSATLNTDDIVRQTGLTPIESAGRSHPVNIHYQRKEVTQPDAIAAVIRQAYQQTDRHLLVFLPGIREIRAVETRLSQPVLILHGTLTTTPDVKALAEAESTVILATNVAESSITLPGVHTVIDTGLERFAQTHPVTGLTELKTRRISQASATQRAGRAGRLGPGIAIRLWSEDEHLSLAAHLPPPIRECDLTETVLMVAGWGSRLEDLPWLERPPVSRWRLAEQKLMTWGALDGDAQLTPHGQSMLRLGLEPWLGHLLALADPANRLPAAALLAAHISLGRKLDYALLAPQSIEDFPADVRQEVNRLLRRFNVSLKGSIEPISESLLAHALSDRIMHITTSHEGQMISGTRVRFLEPVKAGWGLLVDGLRQGQEVRCFAWIPVSQTAVFDAVPIQESIEFQPNQKAAFIRVRRLGQVILDKNACQPDDAKRIQAWLHYIDQNGENALPWKPADLALKRRCLVAASRLENWPAWPEKTDWADMVQPFLNGLKRLDDLAMKPVLEHWLGYERGQQLLQALPDTWTAPSGRVITLEYLPEKATARATLKLQELFGLADGPTIAGQTPIELELCAPNGRGVANVIDLSHFWHNIYPEVRKELRGRYNKHPWPEDPLTAVATGKTNRQLRSES